MFGCVTVLALALLLDNNVFVFANAKSNVNRMHAAAVERDVDASLSHSQHARDDDDRAKVEAMMSADETADAASAMQRYNDDRLIFDAPIGFREPTTTARPFRPIADASSIKTNATMQNTLEVDGDYTFGVRLKEGTRHGERGEYEIRGGKRVFIIRGYFGYITPKVISSKNATRRDSFQSIITILFNIQGDFHLMAYVFDHTGYHEIPVESGVTDFRPEISGGECDLSTGSYCIDHKLLTLMVG